MKPVLGIIAAACLTSGAAQAAEAPFVGAWKLDPARTRMPDEMKIRKQAGGAYAFNFAGQVETIVVNGREQPGVNGSRLSVKPEAADRWIVERRQGGRLLLRATWTLSKDGRRLADAFRQFNADGTTLSTDFVYQRVGKGTGFAADWRSIKETVNSPVSMQVTPYQGDGLSFASSAKITWNLKFDGRDRPLAGANAPRGASSAVRRVDARTLMITDKYKGKVTLTEDVGLSPDLKVLTITQHIPGHDRPNVLVYRRT